MFDFFKKMKDREFEKEADKQLGKPKNDKVFTVILIVFGVIIAVSLITGIGNIGSGAAQGMNFDFRFSISDGVILGGLTLAYIITKIRKGRK
mgnify:FL=1